MASYRMALDSVQEISRSITMLERLISFTVNEKLGSSDKEEDAKEDLTKINKFLKELKKEVNKIESSLFYK